ncbi:MAG: ankyrin repeat domain-containing protein [Micavibrio sp.]|nr:ankyrin repeat domain-containing protein [Micavibrio sp.]
MSNMPPDSDIPKKPTLADHHWRATLRGRSRDDLQDEMESAITGGNRWRFDMLMQIDAAWALDDRFTTAAIRAGRDDMFNTMTSREPGWHEHARISTLAEEACKAGRLNIVRDLVEKYDADIHHYSDEMLRTSVTHKQTAIVAYLLEKGAEADVWNSGPLKEACEDGSLEIVKLLVDAGAEIENWHGEPLQRAALNGHAAVVDYLLEKGADAKADNYKAFIGAAREGHVDVLKIFTKHNIAADVKESEALTDALHSKQYDSANYLLAHGADINAQHGKALRHAARQGDLETAQFILERGANANLNEARETPLTEAVYSKNPAMITLLMQHGADHTALQNEAWYEARRRRSMPMMRAIVEGHRNVMTRIRTKKAEEFTATFGDSYSVDDLRSRKGPSGDTGLLIAAQTGKFGALVGKANGGRLQADDLYHPDDRIDTVLSQLVAHKNLQDFFMPAFWADRIHEVTELHSQLPAPYQKRVNLSGITAEINYRALRKKAQFNGGFKPPK